MPPIANHGMRGDLGGFADQLEPGRGPPLLGGRLPDRADADVVDGAARAAASICSREWVERPTIASGPMIRRASAGSMSSWPTWTPSAPSSTRQVGVVVDDEERRRCRRGGGRSGRSARSPGRGSSRSRSWIMPAPAAQRGVQQRLRIPSRAAGRRRRSRAAPTAAAAAAARRSPRVAQDGSVPGASFTPARSVDQRSTMDAQREPTNGLRGRRSAADRLNLIRVMPAQGGWSASARTGAMADHTDKRIRRDRRRRRRDRARLRLARGRARARASACSSATIPAPARPASPRGCWPRSARRPGARRRCSTSTSRRARAGRGSPPSSSGRPGSRSATPQRGALHVALDRDEAEELRRRYELIGRLGLASEWLLPGVPAGSSSPGSPRPFAAACTSRARRASIPAADRRAARRARAREAVGCPRGRRGDRRRSRRAAVWRVRDRGRPQLRPRRALVLAAGCWSGRRDWLPPRRGRRCARSRARS